MLGTPLSAAEPGPNYWADFEVPLFNAGSIQGQQGWQVDQGRAEIVAGMGIDGTSSLVLYPADPFAQARLSLKMTAPVPDAVFVEMQMVMVAADAEQKAEALDVDSARIGLFRSQNGKEAWVWVFSGDGEGGGGWLQTEVRLSVDPESGQALHWHKLTVGEDWKSQSWRLWIDDVLAASDVGFQNRREAAGPVFILMGDHAGAVVVDDFGIWSEYPNSGPEASRLAVRTKSSADAGSSVPAVSIVDTDGDGMPDEWEKTHGLDPAQESDGNADPDKDGLLNRDEFALGTDPNKADLLAAHLPPARTEVFSRMQLHTIRQGKAVDVRHPYNQKK